MADTRVSPLRQRMIEDMTMRNFAPQTQEGYIRAVRAFVPAKPRAVARGNPVSSSSPLARAGAPEALPDLNRSSFLAPA